MTWKTPYHQEIEELASGPSRRFPFAGTAVLVASGVFWFSVIGAGLWLASFL